MPKEVFHIRQFHGGINDASASTDIADHECQVATDCELGSVGRILLPGSLNNAPSTDPDDNSSTTQPGRGLFAFSNDRDKSGNLETVDYYATHHNGTIKVWSSDETGTWTTIVTHSTATNNEIEFLFNDGILRMSDAQLHSNNPRKWWGYISRTQFPGTGKELTIAEMSDEPAELSAPTDGEVDSDYPAADGNKMNISFTGTTNGSIPNSTYRVAMSFVYDGHQESLLKVISDTINLTTNNALEDVTLWLAGDYSKRLSGARVYVQDQDAADTDWILLVDMEVNDGYRFSLGESYRTGWAGSGDNIQLAPTTGNDITRLGAETYKTINAHEFDEAIDCSYKTATVVDGITYAGYIFQDGKTYPDRILKCGINRNGDIMSDVFPESNFLELTPNDGDYIVNLESFADRVLVFKRNTLFVVNYSDAGVDYLEDTYPNMGIARTGHAFPTAHGIVFMNDLGVHIYDGETVRTLTGKMQDATLPGRTAAPIASVPAVPSLGITTSGGGGGGPGGGGPN